MRWTTVTLLSCALLVLIGCGGHAPTLPSPDDVAPPVPPDDIIEVDDFIVPFGETVVYDRNTEVRASGRVQIDGEVIGADGSGPGANGASVTIVAEGDIAVTGVVKAGDGVDGTDRADTGAGDAGGDGGSVTLRSTAGDITLGVAPDGEPASAKGQGTRLAAGNGGRGGDGLVGGAGGLGGNVMIECLAGLLTLHPNSRQLHIGNGGDGGTGHVPEGYEGDLDDLPEGRADGGHSGGLSMKSQDFAGLEKQDGTLVVSPPDLISGGNGGNGGALWIGLEVGAELPDFNDVEIATAGAAGQPLRNPAGSGLSTGARMQTVSGPAKALDDGVQYHTAGRGGDGVHPGKAGTGGMSLQDVSGVGSDPDAYVAVQGGSGGDLSFPDGIFPSWAALPYDGFHGGAGGEAYASADWDGWGRAPDCQPGGHGRSGYAKGGKGGSVSEDGVPAGVNVWFMKGGSGGDAYARSGLGQAGGNCCDPPGPGGKGGDGGRKAVAQGGDGGDQTRGEGGDGGHARAQGACGNSGGDGRPPGEGGVQTATVSAKGGEPGRGTAQGSRGMELEANGEPGKPGLLCPGEPPPPTGGYGVVTGDSTSNTVSGYPNFYTSGLGPRQIQPGFTLGGNTNRLMPALGRSMIFNSDNSVLWLAHEGRGMCMFSNPLTGGDRAPDRVLSVQGQVWRGFWYEQQRDIVYGTALWTGLIYAWNGASTGNANRPPDRQIEIANYLGGASLTGAPGWDRLFVAARVDNVRKVLVYDRADQATGAAAPDRVFQPQDDFRTHALAWDAQRDILYLCQADQKSVAVITSASTREGNVAPARTFNVSYPNMPADDFITAMVTAPDHDLLFVSTFMGHMLVYTNASAREGTPVAGLRAQLGDSIVGMGVFRQ